MASIITSSFKINLKILNCDLCEFQKGNPYNTNCSIEIYSNGFYGCTIFLINYKDLVLFINSLKDMYNNLSGKTSIKDYDYGSWLKIECDIVGNFIFSGLLINDSFQEFKFINKIDQTYLNDFLYNLISEIKSL